MNWTLLIGLVSAGAWIVGLYQVVQGIRARSAEGDRVIVKSAVELLKEHKEEAAQLKRDLTEAKTTIENLTGQLEMATNQVHDLTEQLGDAQAEVRLLRLQVKTMSQQLPGGNP